MDASVYQDRIKDFAIYPNIGNNLVYPVLGLANEAGEVAGKLKKVMRDNNNIVDDMYRSLIKAELGDVMWYLAQTCTELGVSLSDVMKENIEKLQDRKDRNVIGGNGDKR
jgi:NTP pyrophosphatase (non-canonical NTP hydrolase)